jgi:hypothetical protein
MRDLERGLEAMYYNAVLVLRQGPFPLQLGPRCHALCYTIPARCLCSAWGFRPDTRTEFPLWVWNPMPPVSFSHLIPMRWAAQDSDVDVLQLAAADVALRALRSA